MPHLNGQVDESLGVRIGCRSLRDLCVATIDIGGKANVADQNRFIPTTTASGELRFNIFSSLRQFERHLSKERTPAALTTATGFHFLSACSRLPGLLQRAVLTVNFRPPK